MRVLGMTLLVVAATFAALGARSLLDHSEPPLSVPYNVILISIDTLRADHLGVYGYERDTSPNLDRFAADSTLFERAVAQAPNTKPSHASLFTSLYYSVHRVIGDETTRIPDWRITLPEILQDTGMETAGFVDGGYLRRVFGFDQGFDHYEDEARGIAPILESVDRWLDQLESSRFFLFVHCYDVHSPYAPPPPFDTMFESVPYTGDFSPTSANLAEVNKSKRPLPPKDLEHVIARYDGGIRYVDAQMGGFFDNLERRGLLDSSIVIVTSDHGEEFMEHGSLLHWQTHFTPNLHVPLIVYVPKRARGRVTHTVELVDVLPTILELLDLPPHPPAMGQSLVAALDGHASPIEQHGIAFGEPFLLKGLGPTAISNGYQLFHNRNNGRTKLFNTGVDPGATRNVARQVPTETDRLLVALDQFRERVEAAKKRDAAFSAATVEIDSVTRDQLKALGYVD